MYRQAPESPSVAARRTSKTLGSRDASQILTASFAKVADGLICECVETPGCDILRELLVPGGGVEAEKPIAESGQIAARELLDGVLNLKNGAHAGRILLSEFEASAETPSPKRSDPAHGTQRLQPGRSRRVRCHVGLRNAPFREHAQAESSPFIQPKSSPTKTYHLNPSTTVSAVAIAPAPRKPHRNSAEAFERPRFLAANRSTTVSIGVSTDGSGGIVWRLG